MIWTPILEARAESLEKISLVFWSKWWHHKDKLTFSYAHKNRDVLSYLGFQIWGCGYWYTIFFYPLSWNPIFCRGWHLLRRPHRYDDIFIHFLMLLCNLSKILSYFCGLLLKVYGNLWHLKNDWVKLSHSVLEFTSKNEIYQISNSWIVIAWQVSYPKIDWWCVSKTIL